MRENNLPLDSLQVAASQRTKERDYWLARFRGDFIRTGFPCQHSTPPTASPQIDHVKFTIGGNPFLTLMKLANESDLRLFIILQAVLVILVNKYTGSKDITLGATVLRTGNEANLINRVLPLRNFLREDMTFKEMLLQVRQTLVEATENQNYPFDVLAEQLGCPPGGASPWPETAILLENIHDSDNLRHLNPNMVFAFLRGPQALEFTLEFPPALFSTETGQQIGNHFITILNALLLDLNTPVSGIDMLSAAEKIRLLLEFNDTAAPPPAEPSIRQLFEKQADKTPDNIALVGSPLQKELMQISYRQFNENANRVAARLQAKGIGPGSIVGIMVVHALEMPIGIMGILKTGAAYLPIEAETPENRVVAMLEDCRVSLLLTQSSLVASKSFTVLQGTLSPRLNVTFTGKRPQISDLETLPTPDRSLVNYEKYGKHIGLAMFKDTFALQATRGCPFKCAYCHKIWPRTHIVRSAQHIFDEVRHYTDMGVRRFAFIDDIFNLDLENSSRFFRLILRHGLDKSLQFFFPNGLRGDRLTKEYIDLAVEAGTVNISLSLETASPRLQKLIGKNLDIDQLRENILYICAKHPGLILELQYMHGFPTETEAEALLTLEFIKSIQWLHFPYLHILKIYPNTDMAALALENGVSAKAIKDSARLAYHELPATLPFERSFTVRFQADFFNDYFLAKERLLAVLPHQLKLLGQDELVQKYDSYLPIPIGSLEDLLRAADMEGVPLTDTPAVSSSGSYQYTPGLMQRLQASSPRKNPAAGALRILLLDLSQFFSSETDMLYDVVEAPLGLMYLLTYLNHHFGEKVDGRIAKSRIDFDSYGELQRLLEELKPEIIGLRCLTFHKDFFHRTIAMIRHWGSKALIVTGGPYATSDYEAILRDRNIDLAVLGEGEETFAQLIGKILEKGKQPLSETTLAEIPGIAFIPGKKDPTRARHLNREILFLDLPETAALPAAGDPFPSTQAHNLAYVMYTSGSTGKPNGVMVEQQALVNLCTWHNRCYDVTYRDRATKYAGFGFDASVWEIFPYLAAGASLHLLPDDIKLDLEALNRYFETQRITLSFLPTQVGEQFMKLENNSLRALLVGGDKLRVWQRKNYRVYNNYGPTENTVVATNCPVEQRVENIPIGKPIGNNRLYIIDRETHRLLPPGAPGELAIAGRSLARGYCNQPALTATKFVTAVITPSSFTVGSAKTLPRNCPGNRAIIGRKLPSVSFLSELTDDNKTRQWDELFKSGADRLYKTGDLARWLPDGNIQFLGRIDQQVKVRGNRIELGEIETHLLDHPKVREAVIMAWDPETGNSGANAAECSIWAYISAAEELQSSELRAYLARELPDYMIPAHFVQVERIPLTPGNKVDKKALANCTRTLEPEATYVPPKNEQETAMVEIWKQALQTRRVGINDNFFDLGGNSLKIIEVRSTIQQEFNVDIPVVKMFRFPTVRTLVEYLHQEEQAVRDREQELKQGKMDRKNLLRRRTAR
jgi:amino acid adenylation domain-containing protein